MMLSPDYLYQTVNNAIQEDVGSGDITASLLPENLTATAEIITRDEAIICGCAFVTEVFRQLDQLITISWSVKDGHHVSPNQVLAEIVGPVRSLLTGERIALNFLQTLSGTATQTHRYSAMLQNTGVQLLDTRKTIPGLRMAQKYAVTCGGGKNHRLGLFDAYLIKENHIAACGSIEKAIIIARQKHPNMTIEVEVENLKELEEALIAKADIIMLDNFDIPSMREAVEVTAGRCKLEVSGNVTRQQLLEIAATGVDYISVGALTKHLEAVDLSMRIKNQINFSR